MLKKINARSILLNEARNLECDEDFMALSLKKLERMDALLDEFVAWVNENDPEAKNPETDEGWRILDGTAREIERRRCIASPSYKEFTEARRVAFMRKMNRKMFNSRMAHLEADTQKVYDLALGVPPGIGTRKKGGMFLAEVMGTIVDELHIIILDFAPGDLELILWDGPHPMTVRREGRMRVFSGIERGREYVLEMTSLGEELTSHITLRVIGDVAFPLSRDSHDEKRK